LNEHYLIVVWTIHQLRPQLWKKHISGI